ncbi:TetR/AcrR family transcriptional regulator [bacterium]|nr:TetR/AcrR family transcriptional regulator [bacterium]
MAVTKPKDVGMTDEELARREEKRQQFYEAAEPLFERFGFKKTTVEEICRDAGASKRTFYELFNDKGDLAQNLMLHVGFDMFRQFNAKVKVGMSSLDKLDLIIVEYVNMGRSHKIFHILMKDPDLFASMGEHANELQFRHMIEAMKQVLDEGIERGDFRTLDSDAATWMIFSLLDSMYYLIPEFQMGVGAFEDQHLAREIRDFLMHAIVHPDKVRELS